MKHSALPMDLALGAIDFIEVFQFGILKTEPLYELLNAGFRVTGIAGSDFPANLGRFKPWPRAIPAARAGNGRWSSSEGSASPGPAAQPSTSGSKGSGGERPSSPMDPLLDLVVRGPGPPARVRRPGKATRSRSRRRGSAPLRLFHRPLDNPSRVIVNGQCARGHKPETAAQNGDLRLNLRGPCPRECLGGRAG